MKLHITQAGSLYFNVGDGDGNTRLPLTFRVAIVMNDGTRIELDEKHQVFVTGPIELIYDILRSYIGDPGIYIEDCAFPAAPKFDRVTIHHDEKKFFEVAIVDDIAKRIQAIIDRDHAKG